MTVKASTSYTAIRKRQGRWVGASRRDLEARTQRSVVSSENYKALRQGRQ